jgi:hypothetical protein
MAHYSNIPPYRAPYGGTYSRQSSYGPYTPSSTDSYSSSHPLFSPKIETPPAGPQYQNDFFQSPTAYHHPQQQFEVHPPTNLPPRPRKLRHRISHEIQRLWLWEVSAICVAIATHLAMIALLGVYNNARVSSWTKPWTLNSNISLMITVIKGAALIPVAASLGQLKWRRFWNFTGLTYMDYYDDASRGFLGSLRLLWHLKLW